MSIVHTFVCDNCGTQNHLSDEGDDFDGQIEVEEGEKDVWTAPSVFSTRRSGPREKEEAEVEEQNSKEPTLYYSVRLDFVAIKKYDPLRIVKQYVKNFSFCSKSCFAAFVEKNMDDKGKITKNKIMEIK